MKPATQWISEHGQSGEYPKVDEPIGCFTAAQVREIQEDAIQSELSEIRDMIAKFLGLKECKWRQGMLDAANMVQKSADDGYNLWRHRDMDGWKMADSIREHADKEGK